MLLFVFAVGPVYYGPPVIVCSIDVLDTWLLLTSENVLHVLQSESLINTTPVENHGLLLSEETVLTSVFCIFAVLNNVQHGL